MISTLTFRMVVPQYVPPVVPGNEIDQIVYNELAARATQLEQINRDLESEKNQLAESLRLAQKRLQQKANETTRPKIVPVSKPSPNGQMKLF